MRENTAGPQCVEWVKRQPMPFFRLRKKAAAHMGAAA